MLTLNIVAASRINGPAGWTRLIRVLRVLMTHFRKRADSLGQYLAAPAT